MISITSAAPPAVTPISPRGRLRRVAMRPTIKDLAKSCGVSPATVSRVLNGKNTHASDEVRAKVLAAARTLGYVPDLSARNLSRTKTRIVGLFASPQIHISEGINESIIEAAAQVLHSAGYDVFFELSAAVARNHPLPFWRFDGAILMQAPRPATVAEMDRRRIPYVCINEQVGNPVAQVLSDDAMGMTRAVDHLYRLGHKKVAYANARTNYFSHYSIKVRHETLIAAAKQRGMRLAEGHGDSFNSPAEFIRSTVLDSGATAVITYDHHIAIVLAGVAASMGIALPDRLSLVCFNDVFPLAIMVPPLTAVSVAGREMGRIGSELLLNHLLDRDRPPSRRLLVPEDLIVRGSTAPPHRG